LLSTDGVRSAHFICRVTFFRLELDRCILLGTEAIIDTTVRLGKAAAAL